MKRTNFNRTSISGGVGVPPINLIWADGDDEAWSKGVNYGEVYVDDSRGSPVMRVLMEDTSVKAAKS